MVLPRMTSAGESTLLPSTSIQRSSADAHPYAAWIETYADPAFAAATTSAIGFADRAFRAGSPAERDAMIAAFERSSRYEWMFFAQGTDLPAWPV